MKQYDFIIAGGGAAGLSLACYLSKSSISGSRILIIDKDRKQTNDRTWGFWHQNPAPFDEIVSYRFSNLNFFSRYFQQKINLGDYTYSVIRGIDFYNFIKDHLKRFPNIEFLCAPVDEINDNPGGAEVITPEGTYSATWIFNSIFKTKEIEKAAASGIYLRQHFKGLVIETPKPVFDPSAVTMFDFRTPQNGLMRFFYVIPQSANRALVEYTVFSEYLLEQDEYNQAIQNYIREIPDIEDYKIIEEEFGVIPMTNYRFPATAGKHIVNIGSAGGSSKPSSGYTFLRIQNHVRQIVESLEDGRSPLLPANTSGRYLFYDSVLLNILKRRGDLAEKLFSYMFKNNSIGQIFRFLDEEGGLANDLKIITSLPPVPFLKSTMELLFK